MADANRISLKVCRHGVDVCKLFMSVCVVAIHTHPLAGCSNRLLLKLYVALVNCAVPFFFISAGCFLGLKLKDSKPEHNLKPVLQYLRKILRMYLMGTLVYLPLTVIGFRMDQMTFLPAARQFLQNVFFVGENYVSWHLWYLLSTVYGLLFVIVLRRMKVKPAGIAIAGFALYSLFVILEGKMDTEGFERIRYLFRNTIVSSRVMMGVFLIPLGITLADVTPRVWSGAALTVVGFYLIMHTGGLVNKYALALCASGIFLTASAISLPDGSVYRFFRAASTDIYQAHLLVWFVWCHITCGELIDGAVPFFMTLLLSAALSCVRILVSSRVKAWKKAVLLDKG